LPAASEGGAERVTRYRCVAKNIPERNPLIIFSLLIGEYIESGRLPFRQGKLPEILTFTGTILALPLPSKPFGLNRLLTPILSVQTFKIN